MFKRLLAFSTLALQRPSAIGELVQVCREQRSWSQGTHSNRGHGTNERVPEDSQKVRGLKTVQSLQKVYVCAFLQL